MMLELNNHLVEPFGGDQAMDHELLQRDLKFLESFLQHCQGFEITVTACVVSKCFVQVPQLLHIRMFWVPNIPSNSSEEQFQIQGGHLEGRPRYATLVAPALKLPIMLRWTLSICR